MNRNGLFKWLGAFALFFAVVACSNTHEGVRDRIDLAGEWHYLKDSTNIGQQENWLANVFPDDIHLPGILEGDNKNFNETNQSTKGLVPSRWFVGKVWFRREITIPESWSNKGVRLFLERTKQTAIWIDNVLVGGDKSSITPQIIDLSTALTPGTHSLTVCVDNSTTNEAEPNWNGILGQMYVELFSRTHIESLQVHPTTDNERINVRIRLAHPPKQGDLLVKLTLIKKLGAMKVKLMPVTRRIKAASSFSLSFDMTGKIQLWDENKQPMYQLQVHIIDPGKTWVDEQSVTFGLRTVVKTGTQYTINGTTRFFRGADMANVFPLTGHPPMDVAQWDVLLQQIKDFGFNLVRFAGKCPPEAAFEAADRLGLYVQIDFPLNGAPLSSISQSLLKEVESILSTYGNHPSLIFLTLSTVSPADESLANHLLSVLRTRNPRFIYSLEFVAVKSWMEVNQFGLKNDGSGFNELPNPSTRSRVPQGSSSNPFFEVGQYQTYPNVADKKKYTGVLAPGSLITIEASLTKTGLLPLNRKLQLASGKLASLCYRADIETALKTQGLAGYRLTALHDNPYQGTPFVGVFDAFMEDKGILSAEDWKQFNNDVVPLLSFDRYCWRQQETFSASIDVANYSNKPLDAVVKWVLRNEDGKVLQSGKGSRKHLINGGVGSFGTLQFSFKHIKTPARLNLTVTIDSTMYKNSYPLWVYPDVLPQNGKGLYVSTVLNKAVMNVLEAGGKVLLMPTFRSIYASSIQGSFSTDWNKQSSAANATLGLLMDPKHPVFKEFPTEMHSNWQWWTIVNASRALDLSQLDSIYQPLVRVIDQPTRNHTLGLLCEFKVGNGKLLVCTSKVVEIMDKPEAVQFYNSLMVYMKSTAFNPSFALSPDQLKRLIAYTVTPLN